MSYFTDAISVPASTGTLLVASDSVDRLVFLQGDGAPQVTVGFSFYSATFLMGQAVSFVLPSGFPLYAFTSTASTISVMVTKSSTLG